LFRRPKLTLSCSAEGKEGKKEGRKKGRKEGRKVLELVPMCTVIGEDSCGV
jgi:hypothetical protein